MTDWRERRLGVRARQWNRRESEPAQQAQAAPAPLIITVALRQSAQNHAEEALEALAGLVRNASSEHVRVAAANAILDRRSANLCLAPKRRRITQMGRRTGRWRCDGSARTSDSLRAPTAVQGLP
jgi:hypothetical protein